MICFSLIPYELILPGIGMNILMMWFNSIQLLKLYFGSSCFQWMDSGWNGVNGMSVLVLVVEAHKRRTEHVLDHTLGVYHVMEMK